MSDVTRLLDAVDRGEPEAAEKLLPMVYEELRRLAAAKMAREKPGQTLQATALVHEAYLRMTGNAEARWQSRVHFFRAAAEAMRCILVDNARRKGRLRRGGGLQRVELQDLDLATNAKPETCLIVNEAMEVLATQDPVKAELVKLRFFAGLTNEEAAKVLKVSLPTIKRYWNYSRAWLLTEIKRIAQDS
jgi:RNA polymerase sigma factor (TIGR02999 family)